MIDYEPEEKGSAVYSEEKPSKDYGLGKRIHLLRTGSGGIIAGIKPEREEPYLVDEVDFKLVRGSIALQNLEEGNDYGDSEGDDPAHA